MNSTLETAATPGAAAGARGYGMANTLLMLGKRELWEHRGLWAAPLVVAGILIALCVVAIIHAHPDLRAADLSWFSAQQRADAFLYAGWSLASPLFLVAYIVIFFYLCDCLYAERKDRSILFWKSLPVSDELTVAAKFLIGAVVVPLGVWALAVVTGLVFLAFWNLFVSLGGAPQLRVWDAAAWASAQGELFLLVVASALWYAPIYAYLMLVSAWARRSVLMWVSLPPTVAPLLEWLSFRTHYIWDFIRYRSFGIWQIIGLGKSDVPIGRRVHIGGMGLGAGHFGAAFSNLDLWLGVLVAIALLYAAARIRRYRDDT
jgi:ABC-2 type transport system permease protein